MLGPVPGGGHRLSPVVDAFALEDGGVRDDRRVRDVHERPSVGGGGPVLPEQPAQAQQVRGPEVASP